MIKYEQVNGGRIHGVNVGKLNNFKNYGLYY